MSFYKAEINSYTVYTIKNYIYTFNDDINEIKYSDKDKKTINYGNIILLNN